MQSMKKFLRLLLSLFLSLTVAASCVTEEPRQKPDQPEITETHQWTLSDFAIRPLWDDRDTSVPVMFPATPETVPPRFILSENLPVGDQGSQASGSAWAAGFTAFTYLNRKKTGNADYICSPAYIFNQLNRGINRIIEIREAADFLVREGCADLSLMPYREFDHLYTPTVEARRNASLNRLSGYARVDYLDISQIQGHLLLGNPLVIQIRVYDNFLELNSEVWESPVGRFLGRHSVAVIGYDNDKELIYIHNSAGGKWGKNGRAAIPYSWFLRLTEKAFVFY